jgi:hypothetical protein
MFLLALYIAIIAPSATGEQIGQSFEIAYGSNVDAETASRALSDYKDAIRSRPPVAMNLDIAGKSTQPGEEPRQWHSISAYRDDGNRIEVSADEFTVDKNGKEQINRKPSDFWNGKIFVSITQFAGKGDTKDYPIAGYTESKDRYNLLATTSAGGIIDGYVYMHDKGKVEHIAEILGRELSSTTTRTGKLPSGGDVIVYDIDAKHGRYKLVLDASPPHNMLRLEVTRSAGQANGVPEELLLTNLKYQTFGNVQIATETLLQQSIQMGAKLFRDSIQFTRCDIELNPDFDALKAFRIDVPVGTRFAHFDIPGVYSEWNGERLLPSVSAQKAGEIVNRAASELNSKLEYSASLDGGEKLRSVTSENSGAHLPAWMLAACGAAAVAIGIALVAFYRARSISRGSGRA